MTVPPEDGGQPPQTPEHPDDPQHAQTVAPAEIREDAWVSAAAAFAARVRELAESGARPGMAPPVVAVPSEYRAPAAPAFAAPEGLAPDPAVALTEFDEPTGAVAEVRDEPLRESPSAQPAWYPAPAHAPDATAPEAWGGVPERAVDADVAPAWGEAPARPIAADASAAARFAAARQAGEGAALAPGTQPAPVAAPPSDFTSPDHGASVQLQAAVEPAQGPARAVAPLSVPAASTTEPAEEPLEAEYSDATAPPPGRPMTRRERFRSWRFAPVVEIIATVALALALAESVQAAVIKPFVIPSQSMEPTLLPGQRVLVNRLAYDFGGTPGRGDIVVFHPPSSLTCRANVPLTEPCPQSFSTHASDYFVKRVIGLPGDTLSIKDGHPVIDGRELTNEPYITPCSDSTSCNMPHAIVIPPGHYYMLGDNRGDSDDSRYWGPVPLSWIIGEVFATYWPLDRIGFF